MNVVQALAEVSAELPGIAKGEKSPQGYAFRGIEAITKEVGPLLAKHGVVFVPSVRNIEIRDILVNNKPWTDTILTVRYTVFGPEGLNDAVEIVTVGIGRDNSDKGANKAMSQAYKYALLQTLCIADAKDDGDFETVEAEVAKVAPPRPKPAKKERIDRLVDKITALDPGLQAEFQRWKDDQGFAWPWSVKACDAVEIELVKLAAKPVEVPLDLEESF